MNELCKTLELNSSGKILPIEIKINPNNLKKVVVVNYPGLMGDIDGYNMKYQKLAKHISERIGTTLRMSGPDYISGTNYEQLLVNKLDTVIQYILNNSQQLAGVKESDIEINLIGFSAGASGVAVVSSRYPQIKKILLIAPSLDAGEDECKEGLGNFKGEVYGIIGKNDEIVGKNSLEVFSEMAKNASIIKKVIIPNCDHQFRGTENGIIMSASPVWAFNKSGKGDIDSKDGIVLY